jgi:hypothetical protein
MRPGLVALGDSITNGEGTPMLGVRAWSWAQWLATAQDLPYTGLAADGALATDVLREQVPRLDGPYAIGCLYAGVNDVRRLDFALEPFAGALAAIVDAMASSCERLVMPTIPLDLGRPRAGEAKVRAANAVIEREAQRAGAAVVDLAGLRGWRLVLPDAVHLTAAGQLHLADRAAAALGVAPPSQRCEVDRTWLGAARYAVSGHAAALGRDWRRRAVEGAVRRLSRGRP